MQRAVEWLITPHRIPGWRRAPVIAISQVGYHPDQDKRAVIELEADRLMRDAEPADFISTEITDGDNGAADEWF